MPHSPTLCIRALAGILQGCRKWSTGSGSPAHPDTDSNSDGNSYADSDSNSHANLNTHRYPDFHPDFHPDMDPHNYKHLHADADPDVHEYSDSYEYRGVSGLLWGRSGNSDPCILDSVLGLCHR